MVPYTQASLLDTFSPTPLTNPGNARKKRRLESQVARVNPLQLIRDWQKQQNIQPSAPDLAPAVVKEPQEEALLHNDFEGRPEKGRQLSETVTEFVKRMPPLKSVTIDGWIWCAKPIVVSKKDGKKKVQRFDLGEFVDKGQVLLEDFDEEKAKVESEYEGKAASTITRKLGPFRDRLKEDILEAAIKHGVTSGKVCLYLAALRHREGREQQLSWKHAHGNPSGCSSPPKRRSLVRGVQFASHS